MSPYTHEQERAMRAEGFELARTICREMVENMPGDYIAVRLGSILAANGGGGYAKGDPYAAFVEVEHGGRLFYFEIREVARS